MTNKLFALLVTTGGFTVDGNTINPEKGYSVGIGGGVVLGRGASALQIRNAIVHIGLKAESYGGWYDRKTGKVFIDPIKVLTNKKDAIKLGKELNELAIFDLKKKEEIRL